MNAAELLSHGPAEVVELATAVALAVRVGPDLLRCARLTLVPGASAGTESDLWFGPLVESFGPSGFVLRAEVVDELRRRLVADPARLEASWALVHGRHPWTSPSVAAEERLIYLALTRGNRARKEMDAIFASVLRAMTEGPARATQLARWAQRALPGLPAPARAVESAGLLEAVVTARMPTVQLVDGRTAASSTAIPPELLGAIGRTEYRFDWVTGQLIFRDDGEHAIALPATRPPLLLVSWGRRDREQHRHVVESGKRIEVSRTATELVLEAVDGQRWRLRRLAAPRRGEHAPRLPPPPWFAGRGTWLGDSRAVLHLAEQLREASPVDTLRAPRGGGKTTFLKWVMTLYRRDELAFWQWPIVLIGTADRDPDELARDVLRAVVKEVDGDVTGDQRQLVAAFRAANQTVAVLVDEQEPRTPAHTDACLARLSDLARQVPIRVILATSWQRDGDLTLPALTRAEVRAAVNLHETEWSADMVDRLHHLTAGNPGLVHHLVLEVERRGDARDPWLVDHWTGPFGHHLRTLARWCGRYPDDATTLRRTGPEAQLDSQTVERVAESGLVNPALQLVAPVYRLIPALAHDLAIGYAPSDRDLAFDLARRLDNSILVLAPDPNATDRLRMARRCAILVSHGLAETDDGRDLVAAAQAAHPSSFIPILVDDIRRRRLKWLDPAIESIDLALGVDEVVRLLKQLDR